MEESDMFIEFLKQKYIHENVKILPVIGFVDSVCGGVMADLKKSNVVDRLETILGDANYLTLGVSLNDSLKNKVYNMRLMLQHNVCVGDIQRSKAKANYIKLRNGLGGKNIVSSGIASQVTNFIHDKTSAYKPNYWKSSLRLYDLLADYEHPIVLVSLGTYDFMRMIPAMSSEESLKNLDSDVCHIIDDVNGFKDHIHLINPTASIISILPPIISKLQDNHDLKLGYEYLRNGIQIYDASHNIPFIDGTAFTNGTMTSSISSSSNLATEIAFQLLRQGVESNLQTYDSSNTGKIIPTNLGLEGVRDSLNELAKYKLAKQLSAEKNILDVKKRCHAIANEILDERESCDLVLVKKKR